eukprot:GHVU01014623.1.p1 GENE.GHVU01014623.1~~GHVU01014623.1.p1  ORF type:complete len:111 (+),score=2.15 GHVU01014623.1:392-724(+)
MDYPIRKSAIEQWYYFSRPAIVRVDSFSAQDHFVTIHSSLTQETLQAKTTVLLEQINRILSPWQARISGQYFSLTSTRRLLQESETDAAGYVVLFKNVWAMVVWPVVVAL